MKIIQTHIFTYKASYTKKKCWNYFANILTCLCLSRSLVRIINNNLSTSHDPLERIKFAKIQLRQNELSCVF
jgi:hypothetical protein